MHFNPQLFKVSIIQTKLFGPLDFELSRFHCNLNMKMAAMAAILDIGMERFSNSESQYHPNTSHTTSSSIRLAFQEQMWFKDFQDRRHGGHPGYRNETTLAILNLHVTPTDDRHRPRHELTWGKAQGELIRQQ